jgi:hypothetical protein
MTTTAKVVLMQSVPLQGRHSSHRYLTEWCIRLDCDSRWRRVRCAGGALLPQLYVHVGATVLHLEDENSSVPLPGKLFVRKTRTEATA